jgi:hypothetical protein
MQPQPVPSVQFSEKKDPLTIPFHPRGSATPVANSKESRMKFANATKP